jgi:hypothetical protein
MQGKRRLAISTAVVTLALLLSPAPAVADPVYTVTGDVLSAEYQYGVGEDAPEIKATVQYEGAEWALDEVLPVQADDGYERPTRRFSDSRTLLVNPDEIDTVAARFPGAIALDSGDYHGLLTRTGALDVVRIDESMTRQVDREEVFEGLPDNDVIRIPATLEFEVSSDDAQDAVKKTTLERLDVVWEIKGTNALGLPDDYTAYVTYRGEESYRELHHYEVTAHYSGDIPEGIERFIVSARYKRVEPTPPVLLVPQPEPLAATATQPVPSAPFPWLALALILAAAALLAGSLILFFWLRRRFRVCLLGSDNRLVTVTACRIKSDREGLVVHIPGSIDLTGLNGDHVGVCSKAYRRPGMVITAFQDGRQVYSGAVLERIPLFNEDVYQQVFDSVIDGGGAL